MQQRPICLLAVSPDQNLGSYFRVGIELGLHVQLVDSPTKLYQIMKDTRVDGVLVDISWPRADGIGVLKNAMKLASNIPGCWIIALTSVEDPSFVDYLHGLGVHQCAKRTILELDPAHVLEETIFGIHQNRWYIDNEQAINHVYRSLEQEVMTVLAGLGTPMHVRGYGYLKTAIEMVVNNPNILSSVTKQLYPSIAEMYQTKSSCVERAMRHAIQIVFQRNRSELKVRLFDAYLDIENEKPTNTEFIATTANWIRMKFASSKDVTH